jgi:uncharacterized membrane protein
MTEPIGLYIMAIMYIVAGLMHFVKPKTYMRVMPKYLPKHKALVFWSGIAELLLGVGLCIHSIIAMLAIFLMVHFYMLSSEKASTGIPKWILILRIPLQFGLMYLAWMYLN